MQSLARGWLARSERVRAFKRVRAARMLQRAERSRMRRRMRSRLQTRSRVLPGGGDGLSERSIERALAAREDPVAANVADLPAPGRPTTSA